MPSFRGGMCRTSGLQPAASRLPRSTNTGVLHYVQDDGAEKENKIPFENDQPILHAKKGLVFAERLLVEDQAFVVR